MGVQLIGDVVAHVSVFVFRATSRDDETTLTWALAICRACLMRHGLEMIQDPRFGENGDYDRQPRGFREDVNR
jgi:hypothetical protein